MFSSSKGKFFLKRRFERLGDKILHTYMSGNLTDGRLHLCPFCSEVHLNRSSWDPEGIHCPTCDSIGRERFMYYVLLQVLGARGGRFAPTLRTGSLLAELSLLEFSPRADKLRRPLYNQLCGTYTASDFDQSNHVGDIKVDLADSASVAAVGARFDVVLFSHVLEHIPDYEAALENIRSLIKPGGMILLQVPLQEAQYTKVDWDEFHGDNTRVYHRFSFDLSRVLQRHFGTVTIHICDLMDTVDHPEIKGAKYEWLQRQTDLDVVVAGYQANQCYGFGPPEYCETFVLQ